jgi:predicted metal-dependent hydrolase
MEDRIRPGSIPVEVEYRGIKNMRITVYPPDGKVRITAPFDTPMELIRNFAVSKTAWIEKHREKFRSRSKTPLALKNNGQVWVWGEALVLEIAERRGNPKILVTGGIMKMQVRPGSQAEKHQALLDKWYRRLVGEAAQVLIKKWEPLIGVKVEGLYIRKMKSHWGSCNAVRRTLRLNSELAKKPPDCLEYVIVHEMLHIIEVHHNEKFYRLLNRFIPSWKEIRKKMNAG